MGTGTAGAEGSWQGTLHMGVGRRREVARGRSGARSNGNQSYLNAGHANGGTCLDLHA